MIICNFNDFKNDPEKWDKLLIGLSRYTTIMDIKKTTNATTNATFQYFFSKFYDLNPTWWIQKGHGGNFYAVMNELSKKGPFNYATAINELQKKAVILGSSRIDKSFASKILHTYDDSKPILDKKVLEKLFNLSKTFPKQFIKSKKNKVSGVYEINAAAKYTIKESITLYGEIEQYYKKIIPANSQYLQDFDAEFNRLGLSAYTKISDAKKIDFWMWLA